MKSLYSRSYATNINREGPRKITSRVLLLDSFVEMVASLTVNTPDSTIISAELCTLRGLSRADHNNYHSFAELTGISLYDKIGKAFDLVTQSDSSGYHRALLVEAFHGVMGSRGQLSEESGFASIYDLSKYWSDVYKNKCMMYSNFDKVERIYPDYFAELALDKRTDFLFSRITDYHVYHIGSELLCCGSLKDTFHQMNVLIRLDPQGRQITDASGEIFRSPDISCRKASEVMSKLIGTSLGPKNELIQDIRKLVVSGDGCFHLGDMAEEIVGCLDLSLGFVGADDLALGAK